MSALRYIDRKRFRQFAAVIGVLVIAAFAMTQAIHAHPELGFADNAHCAVCAVGHVTPAIAIPIAAPVLVLIRTRLVLFEPLLRATDTASPLYCRPPPSMA